MLTTISSVSQKQTYNILQFKGWSVGLVIQYETLSVVQVIRNSDN